MAGKINTNDLGRKDLEAWVMDLRARVAQLELQVGTRTVTFVPLLASVATTSFEAVAFTVFPRSGSTLAVDVVTGGALEATAIADGVSIATGSVIAAGTITLQGFLPETWPYGERRRVEVRCRRTSGSGAVSAVVVGAWHR
ncbi:hypothetical protein ACGFJC_47210 [Nonomuraea fuscirosea]|uniref:hypothetical protein n=1 Tax=Nonomuraea fuscirosea TaxID=1291556 RepID=UPI00371374A6